MSPTKILRKMFLLETFRSAFENANLDPDVDMIIFDESQTIIFPESFNVGHFATEPVWINGTIANGGKIVLDGTNSLSRALNITRDNIVTNVVMRNFPDSGIHMTGGGIIV